MAQPSVAEISSRVRDMLTGANLDLVTAKTVRRNLEEHYKMDLSDRKKEIGSIINSIINSDATNGCTSQAEVVPVKKEKREASPAEDDEELARKLQQEEEETQGKRATRSGIRGDRRKSNNHSKKKAKTKKHVSDSSDNESSGSQSDADDKGSKDKDKKKTQKGGYLKSIPLSHELAEFMGAEAMPRHEVVKRVWSYCKENNLLDPKNKQFAICDDELRKVFGVKRFRLFGMMKILGKHFHSAAR